MKKQLDELYEAAAHVARYNEDGDAEVVAALIIAASNLALRDELHELRKSIECATDVRCLPVP